MRNLKANEMTNVNGGACHYDAATEQALVSLSAQLSALGLLGSSVEKNARAEIISHATSVICD